MNDMSVDGKGKCPIMHGASKISASGSTSNQHWWPEQLNLKILNQNSVNVNPMGEEFDYVAAFNSLDFLKTGGPLITVIMVAYLYVWLGIAPEHIAPMMVVVARLPGRNALPLSTAGPIMGISIKLAACYGL